MPVKPITSRLFLSTPSARRATSCTWSFESRQQIFLSTPSARRATFRSRVYGSSPTYFYPRPPRGGRHSSKRPDWMHCKFLSTPSARRATGGSVAPQRHRGISIHALREEGDERTAATLPPFQYFYPRPPRGGRLLCCGFGHNVANFYPRPPRGGRHIYPAREDATSYFYPRPPRGGRPPLAVYSAAKYDISIHALREEGDVRGSFRA